MYVRINGIWHEGIAYVKTGGEWREASSTHLKVGGSWKEGV